MQQDKWLGWAGLIIVFAIYQIVRAVVRGAKDGNSGMARLNAAAERILKERGASAANPIPRNAPAKRKPAMGSTKSRPQSAALKSSAAPAVIRRGGLLSGGQEPVIQRRR